MEQNKNEQNESIEKWKKDVAAIDEWKKQMAELEAKIKKAEEERQKEIEAVRAKEKEEAEKKAEQERIKAEMKANIEMEKVKSDIMVAYAKVLDAKAVFDSTYKEYKDLLNKAKESYNVRIVYSDTNDKIDVKLGAKTKDKDSFDFEDFFTSIFNYLS